MLSPVLADPRILILLLSLRFGKDLVGMFPPMGFTIKVGDADVEDCLRSSAPKSPTTNIPAEFSNIRPIVVVLVRLNAVATCK